VQNVFVQAASITVTEVDFVDCPMNQYRCPNAQCIMSEWLCDGQVDCPNAEDESSCGDWLISLHVIIYSAY